MKTILISIYLMLILLPNICRSQMQNCCGMIDSLTIKTNDTIKIPDIGNVAVFNYKYWINNYNSDTTSYLCYDWDDLRPLDKRLSLEATKDFVNNYLIRTLSHLAIDTFVKWKVMYTTDCYTAQICTIKAILFSAFICCDDSLDRERIARMAYKSLPDTSVNLIDFHKMVKCGKKCCFVNFTVKKTYAYDYDPPRPYLAIERMIINGQYQQPGLEVYGCPPPTIPHCGRKDPMGQPIMVPCGAGCPVR